VKTITSYFLANKKSHSCWLLVLWVPKIAYSKVVVLKKYSLLFLALTKAMQTLPIYPQR
jgi:hypothetical protein